MVNPWSAGYDVSFTVSLWPTGLNIRVSKTLTKAHSDWTDFVGFSIIFSDPKFSNNNKYSYPALIIKIRFYYMPLVVVALNKHTLGKWYWFIIIANAAIIAAFISSISHETVISKCELNT